MKNRNIAVDILKIILAFFVIGLHCQFFSDHDKRIEFLTVEGLFRIAVPTFFIINGYFFRIIIDNGKINEWIKRVLILYLIWMAIYSPLWIDFTDVRRTIQSFLIGHHHLWYINSMLICGIILYRFKKMNSTMMLVLSLFLFLTGVTIQYLGNYHIFDNKILDRLTNIVVIHRNFLFIGIPFFTIGYLINKNNWNKGISPKKTSGLVFLGLIFLLIDSYINYFNTKDGVDNLFSLIFICPLIFIFFINSNIKLNLNSKKTALMSTALYLIHPWVMIILNQFKVGSILLTLLTIIFSLIFSYLIIRINNRLKFLL